MTWKIHNNFNLRNSIIKNEILLIMFSCAGRKNCNTLYFSRCGAKYLIWWVMGASTLVYTWVQVQGMKIWSATNVASLFPPNLDSSHWTRIYSWFDKSIFKLGSNIEFKSMVQLSGIMDPMFLGLGPGPKLPGPNFKTTLWKLVLSGKSIIVKA